MVEGMTIRQGGASMPTDPKHMVILHVIMPNKRAWQQVRC